MENLAKAYHHLKILEDAEPLEIQVRDTRKRMFGQGLLTFFPKLQM